MRLAPRLVLLAVVALIVPVVLAWTAVFAGPARGLSVSHAVRRTEFPIAHPAHYPPPVGGISRSSGIGVDWYSQGWGMITAEVAKDPAVVAGWPFRCVYAYEYRNDSRRGPKPPGDRHAVGIPTGGPSYREGRLRLLPVVPLWGGFAANATLVVLALGPILFRRELASLRRPALGTCAHCRHALLLSQARCPECGRSRRAD